MANQRGSKKVSPAMTYEIRGPDPDGDWFVVLVDGEEETAIDEVFSSAALAQAEADRLNAS